MKIIKEELRFEENLKNRLEQQKQKLENVTSKIESENYSIKEQIGLKDKEINELKDKL